MNRNGADGQEDNPGVVLATRSGKGDGSMGEESHSHDHADRSWFDRWMGQQHEYRGQSKPCDRREVPREAQRADCELGSAKQSGQVVAAKEPNENVAFTEVGMCTSDGGDKECGDVQGDAHMHLIMNSTFQVARPIQVYYLGVH